MLPGKPILLCPQPPSFTAGDQGEVRQNPDSKPKFNYIWDEWNGLYATSIGADERNRIEKLLDEVILEIIAENSWVPKDRLIKDLNTNVLRISITTEERDFAKGNGGKYFPDRGLMALIYRPEPFGSKAYYKTYFLNELASHFIAVSNIVCKADEGTSAGIQTETPLGAKIADTLVRGFHVAIRRMRSIFYKQHDLGMSSLEPDEITSFIEFSYLIKNYLPFPLINPWPDSSVLNYIEEGVLQWGDEQTIVPGPNFQPSITSLSFHGKISGDRIIFHYCAGHFPLKHRMSEFFRRMEFITSNFRKDTPSPYYNLPPNIQFEELASFVLSEMPPALIDLFFEDLQADYQKYISRCEPDPIEKSQTNKATDTAKPSLLNVGFWITAGVGTLRKWWQGNAIKPVKSVRPVAQHATATNSATTFFLPTPAAAENPKNLACL